MSESARILEMYDAVWGSIDQLLDGLSDEDWSTQSLCPDWTVKGVVSHLAAVEHMLAEWMPASGDDPLPFDKVMAFVGKADGMSNADLLADYRAVLATRRDQIAALDDSSFALPSMTPVGPGTYGRFMDVRVFDFWVHERDIRIPLGKPAADEGGSAAYRSVDEVAMSIGYIVGKKIGLDDGQSIEFKLTGPIERSICAAVEGRAKAVDSLQNPDAVVTTDSTTFVMLACGRIDPDQQVEDGKISWSGDDEIGARAARNLAFTM